MPNASPVSSEVPGLPSIDDIVSGIVNNPKTVSAADPEPIAEVVEFVEEVSEVAPIDELEAAAETDEAPVEEVPVEEPAPAPAKRQDPVAHKFAILSRRERELHNRQRELDAREAETQRKLQELQQAPAPTSGKPKNALEALKQLGYSYQDLTLEVLGQKEETPPDPMQQRLDELSERLKKVDELEAEQKRRWEALDKERTSNIETQIRNSIVATAANDDDRYELLTTVGQEAFDLVYDVMQEYYQEKQALLTYEEACDIVEQYYEEKAKALVSTRKLGRSPATVPTPKPSVAPKPTTVSSKASGPKTLTQRHSTIASAEPDVNKMSRDEAIAFLSKKIPVLPD